MVCGQDVVSEEEEKKHNREQQIQQQSGQTISNLYLARNLTVFRVNSLLAVTATHYRTFVQQKLRKIIKKKERKK